MKLEKSKRKQSQSEKLLTPPPTAPAEAAESATASLMKTTMWEVKSKEKADKKKEDSHIHKMPLQLLVLSRHFSAFAKSFCWGNHLINEVK